MISEEDSLTSKRSCVALRGMLRSLVREPVEHSLAERDKLLPEGPAAGSVPWRDAVCAAAHDVEHEARVLQQPRDKRMIDGYRLVNPVL